MAEIRKIGEKYFVEFFGNGLRFQKYAGDSPEAALFIKQKIEQATKEQGDIYRERFVALETFRDEFDASLPGKFSPKSRERISRATGHFFADIKAAEEGLHHLQDVTPRVVENYRGRLLRQLKDVSPHRRLKLANLTFFILEIMFDFAVRQGHLNDSPLLHIAYLTPPGFKNTPGADARLGPLWVELKGQNPGGKLLAREILYQIAGGVENPLKLRNRLIRYLLAQGVSPMKLAAHVGFTDIARWVGFLKFIRKGI